MTTRHTCTVVVALAAAVAAEFPSRPNPAPNMAAVVDLPLVRRLGFQPGNLVDTTSLGRAPVFTPKSLFGRVA
jgi:uncharacterized membrane protein (DUF2068 family)